MADQTEAVKVKTVFRQGAGFGKYRRLCYGKTSFGFAVKAEILTSLFGSVPGAMGLFLRSKAYRSLFGSVGRQILVGRNVTFRHPRKIHLGHRVIIDDGCLIDAKGVGNEGIFIDDDVFVGRDSIVYCKNGDIRIERGANISSHCTLFSSNALTVGEGTVIGAYSYLLSGGEYDTADSRTPFADQSGMRTKGPLEIGANCWIGARATILDAAGLGEHVVIGAGAVVTRPVPRDSLAVGVPARVIKHL